MTSLRKRFLPGKSGRPVKTKQLCKVYEVGSTSEQPSCRAQPRPGDNEAFKNSEEQIHGHPGGVQDEELAGWRAEVDNVLVNEYDRMTPLESQEKLLKTVEELKQTMLDLDDVFKTCVELTAGARSTESSDEKGEEKEDDKEHERKEGKEEDIAKMPPYCQFCELKFCELLRNVVEDGLGKTDSGDLKSGDHKTLDEVAETRTAQCLWVDVNCRADSKLDSYNGPFSIKVEIKLSEDDKKENNMLTTSESAQLIVEPQFGGEEEEDENTMDIDPVRHPSLTEHEANGNELAPSGTGEQVVGMDSRHSRGAWSTRIRKDGKKWRPRNKRFSHVKRTYLTKRPPKEAESEAAMQTTIEELLEEREKDQLDSTIQNLWKGDETGQIELPGDCGEGENRAYEVYDWSWRPNESSTADQDEQEVEDLFAEMALAMGNGWETAETSDDPITLQKGGCSHDYFLHDDLGLVCAKCGLIGQDIQSIFLLQDPSRAKKKSSSPPADRKVDAEINDDDDWSSPMEVVASVTFSLHPFYEEHLHPHQKEGFMFLTKNLIGDGQRRTEPGGCILAHAPGTGKSCLAVSFVNSFLTAFPKGRPLIVAPKIMLKPWQKEFELWNVEDIPTYNLNEICLRRKRKAPNDGEDEDFAATQQPKGRLESRRMDLIKKWLERRSVLLVSYNLFAILVLAGLNDENIGSGKQQICRALLDGPELLILDEGHFPRTKRTKISQALMRVRTQRKILLSGTLFQNNFKELFNLLKLARHNFMSLCPGFATRLTLMDQREPFLEEHNHFAGRTYDELNLTGRECEEHMFMEDIGYKLKEFVQGAENFNEINLVLRKLRTITAPIVHWYAGQILESLPGLCEFVVYLNLTVTQQQLYSHLTCKSCFEEKTRIAEVCIHPALLKYEENLDQAQSDLNTVDNLQQDPSKGVKTAFVFNLLRLCQNSGERLLVFCQTLSPLALIESMLIKLLGWSRGNQVLRLDGTMQSDERQSMIEQFNQGSNKACIMLASITACKEGISLVGASRVVILDVLYNPSVVRQAVSRAFRIGQKKRVYVYRLVAANTKEEKIFQGAVQKDWLSRVLMDQSLKMCSNGFHPENILQLERAPEDKILQKMLHTDASKRIHRICRYHTS